MNDKSAGQKSHRVFFALWPDDDVRQQISQVFRQSAYASAKGRRYLDSNLHITLHFLGNFTAERLNCARQQAADIRVKPFELKINHFGRFRRAGILWLGPESVPAELVELHQQLGDALGVCGYTPEEREYCPHITLMRNFHGKIDESIQGIEGMPLSWPVDHYALVESVSVEGGVEYRPLEIYSAA